MRQRMGKWCALGIAIAGAGLAAPDRVEAGLTLYLGLGNGTTAAYTATAPGAGWTRATSADIPSVYYDALPTLADLDGNGVADALVGERSGKVSAFRNAGTDAAPVWQRMPSWDPPITFGWDAAPALGDIDGDGDADLVVGRSEGDCVALENTGGRSAPVWRTRPDWNVPDIGDSARPALGDIDGDGHVDLVVGSAGGGVFAFRGPAPFTREPAWDPPRVSERTAPGLTDVTGDHRADLFIADGYAQTFPFRNVGGAWSAEQGWRPPNPGWGPSGVAVVVQKTTTSPPPSGPGSGGGGPVASLAASPLQGPPPLRVHFDASASTGTGLTYTWAFGDGDVAGPPTPPDDPDSAIVQAKAAFVKARATRDAGHYRDAIALYLADVPLLLSLTTVTGTGPVTARNTNEIDRVAHYFLGVIGHDLGGIYMFHPDVVGLGTCDRYATALQYLWEAVAQWTAGGWPNISSVNGTDGKISTTLQKLHANGCPVPPVQPPFGVSASLTLGGATIDHTYEVAGTYLARVTVTDGTSSSSAAVTITVGDGIPPSGEGEGDGFGAKTPGGAGGRVIHVSEATDAAVRSAFSTASSGNAVVVFDVAGPIDVKSPLPLLTGPFITIEGNGVTLVGTALPRAAAMIDVRGHDVIVRNMRLRNGGDNLRAQYGGAYNILFSHVSSTGSGDDGISIGYGSHDVTVEYSFLAGNTRQIFIKYGTTTNISIHHSWLMKGWIRAPLVSTSALVDMRNVIVEDWSGGGTRYESAATGNIVNSLFILSPYARSLGGTRNSITLATTGQIFAAGNVFRDQAGTGTPGNASAPIAAPPVATLSVAEMEPLVHASAGCLPRDAVDQAYIDTRTGWDVSKYLPYRLP